MFGREARMPLDILFVQPSGSPLEETSGPEYAVQLRDHLQRVYRIVHTNFRRTFTHQKIH